MNAYQFWSGLLPSVLAGLALIWGFFFLTGWYPALCRFGAWMGMGLYRTQRSIGRNIGWGQIYIHRSVESRMELFEEGL